MTRLISETCKHCEKVFDYSHKSGRYREHCSAECREAHKAPRPKPVRYPCSIAGCNKLARYGALGECSWHQNERLKRNAGFCTVHKCHNRVSRLGAGLCEVHYQRNRRYGRLELVPPKVRAVRGSGYVDIKVPGHPMARSDWASEHRVVAYEKCEGICPQCYWCDSPLSWDRAVIDHLDDVKGNNHPDNLVVSCITCNRLRGAVMGWVRTLRPDRLSLVVRLMHDGVVQREERREQHR